MMRIARQFTKRFAHCLRGNVAVIFGIAAPVVLGIVGLSIDYGTWLDQRTRMQGAADAASLAAAKVYSDTQNSDAADAQASSALSAHSLSGASPSVGLVDGDTAYQVTLQSPGTQYFSGLFSGSAPTIGVSAKASVETGPGPCILALDPTASNSLWLDSNAEINATTCKVHANSSNSRGINAASNSQLNSESTCVVGGYGGSSSHYNPDPTEGCAPVADPLAHIPAPSSSGCNYNDLELDDANTTVSPGVYCGGLTIKGNSNVTFNPGTYVIKDGRLFVDSNSRIQGNGVTFYLTGNDATIEFTSNVVVDFIAPATGPLAGVIFFEDRNAPLNREHYFDSNNISRLEGAIYLSRGQFWSDSNTQISANSAFTTVVANRIRLDSNAQLVLNADYGSSSVPSLIGTVGGNIRLLE